MFTVLVIFCALLLMLTLVHDTRKSRVNEAPAQAAVKAPLPARQPPPRTPRFGPKECLRGTCPVCGMKIDAMAVKLKQLPVRTWNHRRCHATCAEWMETDPHPARTLSATPVATDRPAASGAGTLTSPPAFPDGPLLGPSPVENGYLPEAQATDIITGIDWDHPRVWSGCTGCRKSGTTPDPLYRTKGGGGSYHESCANVFGVSRGVKTKGITETIFRIFPDSRDFTRYSRKDSRDQVCFACRKPGAGFIREGQWYHQHCVPGAISFRCPQCHQAGAWASAFNRREYSVPPGHTDMGDGAMTCPTLKAGEFIRVPGYHP